MEHRSIPGTDLELSVVGFGSWTIGGQWWGPTDDRDSIAAVRRAVELGIDWFDTAPLYGEGHADRVLVEALGPRLREVILATKVGVRIDGDLVESDLRPEHIVADCEASLRRLGLERIDLLQVHWPCEHDTPLADTIGALGRLVEQGKVRHFGLCNYDADALRAARSHGSVVSLQTPHSLLRQEFEGELAVAAQGLGVLAYETLCRGLLAGGYTRQPPVFGEDDQRSWDPRFEGEAWQHAVGLVADLSRAAAELGVPVAALAVGWVLSRPGVTAAIVGARTPAQVEQNVRVAELLGQRAVWRVVEDIAGVHGKPPD